MLVALVATERENTRKVRVSCMQVDAGRCAVVGPSGLGGFERRSTHCFHNLLSIVQRREHAQELVFLFEPQSYLRRCEAQGVGV